MSPQQASLLKDLEARFQIRLESPQIEAMEQYWSLLSKWNRRLSLTTVKSYAELLEFHFFESFLAADRLLRESEGRLADIGSGAGFPGLGVAIFDRWREVWLLESNQRKAVFLTQAGRSCAANCQVFSGRGEDFGGWPQIDVALVRALKTSAVLERLLREHAVPLLALHGNGLPVSGEVEFEVEERLEIPGSRNRRISRLVFS